MEEIVEKIIIQGKEDVYVHPTCVISKAKDELEMIHMFFQKHLNSNKTEKDKKIFVDTIIKICRREFYQYEDFKGISYPTMAALFIVVTLSIRDFEKLNIHLLKCNCALIVSVSLLLNPANWDLCESFMEKRTVEVLITKLQIFQEAVKNHLKHSGNSSDPLLRLCLKNLNPSNKRCLLNTKRYQLQLIGESDVHFDGSLYDRARDPPGQRSVYIPPGDTCQESYRLSTFIKFPPEIPVNPRHLASAGFYYTGYKDRVKCFCCGLCVEHWEEQDDVKSARWHRTNCQFIKGEDSGNVPIGSGGLARFMTPTRHGRSQNSPNSTSSSATAVPSLQNQSVPSPNSTGSPTPASTRSRGQRQSATVFNIVELATIPSAYHENFVRNLDLRKESERLRTFEHWPTEQPTVFSNDLARSGFFYLGNMDRVQCFSCGGVLRNWNYGDNVDAEHRRHFPHCKLVQGQEPRNIPLTPEERAAAPSQQPVFTEPPDPTADEQRDLRNMFRCEYPVSPHMRNEDTRHETFDDRWPSTQINASTRDIARAGFFFLGERDRVKCWYCNGGLQNWDPDDEPWTEHAKWFPTCEFLLRRKGPDFVHRMVSMFPNLPRPLLRGPFDVPPREGERLVLRGSNSGRAPTPPPEIVDPQEEIRHEQERYREAMNSSVVKSVEELGFDIRLIRRVVKRRVHRTNMYTSPGDLIDDITNEEENGEPLGPQDEEAPSASEPGSSSAARRSEAMDEEIPEGATSSMQDRIRELQEKRNCTICKSNPADIVFVPCGHLCCCGDCTKSIDKCPVCQCKIDKAIRTYMS